MIHEENLGTIMVVDDDDVSRGLLESLLKKRGHNVVAVASGEQALVLLPDASIDIVILDIVMPGISGIETCRRIRQDPRMGHLPVIFVTHLGDKKARIEGKRVGGDDFLIKPIEQSELLARVENLMIVRRYYRHLEQEHASLKKTVEEQSDLLGKAMVEISKANRTLRYFNEEIVFRLSKAVEFRDDETGNHVQRMSRYCGIIASKLQMQPEMCDAIRIASALHDVGKIAMPDDILHKPGALSGDEKNVMRRHAEIGRRLLSGSNSDLLELAATIAWTHHERFDGGGYPRGLRGEEIPVEGRIAAVADVFDALTSKRIYKPAYTFEEALRIVKDESGRHFDPKIVDVFVGCLEDIQNVTVVYSDR